METKKIDKLKIIFWGDSESAKSELVNELKKMKIVTSMAITGDDWVRKLQKNSFHAGIIILNSNNFNQAMMMASQLRESQSDIPIFVFTASKEQSALLSEAEENGFNDHFLFPIDTDLVATKLSKYFIQEDLQKFQLEMAQVPKDLGKAFLKLNCKILGIDENGLILNSPHMLMKGADIQIKDSEILTFLGVRDVTITIEKLWPEEDDTFGAYAEWKKDNEELASAVRRWALNLNS